MNVILRNEDYLDENLKKYQSSLGEIVFGYLMAGMIYLFFGGLLCAILESLLLFVSGITIIVGLLIGTIYINIRCQRDLKESSILFKQAYLSSIKKKGKFVSFCFRKNQNTSYKTERTFLCLRCCHLPDLNEDEIIIDYKEKIVYISGLYLLKNKI